MAHFVSRLIKCIKNEPPPPPVPFEDHPAVHKLLESMPMEVAIYDTKGRFLYLNRPLMPADDVRDRLIGETDEALLKAKGYDLQALQKRDQQFQRVLTEKRLIVFTEKLAHVDSSKITYYKRTYQPLFSEEHPELVDRVCSFGQNLTAVILSQNELRYLAYHDRLTGLRNRDAFNQYLDDMIIEARRSPHQPLHAVLFCDLDNFKLVNDTIGHDVGDRVLRETAERMQKTLRRSDYIFRLGGDEFTVILKELKRPEDAGQVAQKIITSLSAPFEIADHTISCISSSVGIALYPRDGEEKETLLKSADTAMYQAKVSGKNSYQFFNARMTNDAMRKLATANKLREVVTHGQFDEEFSIVYQPIVRQQGSPDFHTVGVEALLRWNNPDLGQISPGVFIPIAEESNLIDPIGQWVFLQACKDIMGLRERVQQPIYLSVNLSAKQLGFSDLALKTEEIISSTHIDPRALQLELTETAYLNYESEVIRNIRLIRELGIRLAIDDFGVGYASLSYLQKIPAATLKIDRSFIQNMGYSSESREFVRAIFFLCENLQKDIVAEGVESREQINMLQELSCSNFQGYFFSKPLSLLDLETFLTDEMALAV